MKKYLLVPVILLLASFTFYSNEISEQIISAFKSGNASKLAEYFDKSIELNLFDKEEVYSKTQAEMILRDFFTQHKPTEFKVLHQGGKEASKYAIGSLICGSDAYRVTFLFKSEGAKTYIHQLRIENDYVE
jgi:hypothetical protein